MGEDENYMKFRDFVNFKLISMYCIQPSYQSNDKFLIYTQDQCDRGYYNCLWLQKRSSNILGNINNFSKKKSKEFYKNFI